MEHYAIVIVESKAKMRNKSVSHVFLGVHSLTPNGKLFYFAFSFYPLSLTATMNIHLHFFLIHLVILRTISFFWLTFIRRYVLSKVLMAWKQEKHCGKICREACTHTWTCIEYKNTQLRNGRAKNGLWMKLQENQNASINGDVFSIVFFGHIYKFC